MLEVVTLPLELPFFQRALLASGLAALVCAVVGTFVVLKGLAFMGDAVAHSSLAGMSVAFLFGGNVFWGALAWAVPASLLITLISRRAKLQMDTAIGVIFAGGFALGIILISRVDNYATNLLGLLFGNVLGVSWGEVLLIGIITAAVLLVILALYKELLFTSYDMTVADASGIPVRFVQYLLPVLIGVTTVASLKVVGIVLVLALLVTPAATGTLLARRLPTLMAASTGVALAATIAGLYLSFHLDLPPGPSIVMVSTGLFGLALLLAPGRGVVWRWRRAASLKAGEAG